MERQSRTVTIYRLDVIDWQSPQVTLEVECSRGTYIRSLAHDLGQALGCGAYLKTLVRTRYGPFDIKDGVSLSRFEEAGRDGSWQRFLHPLDYVLGDLRSVSIEEPAVKAMLQGNTLAPETVGIPDAPAGTLCRAYAPDGRFLGIIRYDPDRAGWQPEKVFI